MKAKIRGIYATALTKLLLSHDFDIVQPSEEIADRFGLEASEDEPDLSIRNRLDYRGSRRRGALKPSKPSAPFLERNFSMW